MILDDTTAAAKAGPLTLWCFRNQLLASSP